MRKKILSFRIIAALLVALTAITAHTQVTTPRVPSPAASTTQTIGI